VRNILFPFYGFLSVREDNAKGLESIGSFHLQLNSVFVILLSCYVERAVRLGDAPTVDSVERGARLQGRSEVRFLTFPPTVRLFEFLTGIKTTSPEVAGRSRL
jgi:hypothetical protein